MVRRVSQEVATALIRTGDLVRRFVGLVTGTRGVTPQQYNILRILRGAGEAGLPTLEIAERMIEQTPGITRLLDRLETKALVLRKRCLTDRRQVFCHITSAGLELLADLDQPLHEAEERALGGLTADELCELLSLLDLARKGMALAGSS